MSESKLKPKLVVFDLELVSFCCNYISDYTLWPFWVDTHVTPPFKQKGNDVVDSQGQIIKYYKDVPNILKHLAEKGYKLGVASRTSEIAGAKQLLKLFNWEHYFNYIEIYPGCKVTHFSKIQKQSGIDYKDMIFFDDEHRNIVDVGKLGVTCILVKNGISQGFVDNSLKTFHHL